MSDSWQSILERWNSAGLIDAPTAESIRRFEASHEKPHQFRWPILIAIGFGALMLGAGVLLFVSAHWDELSPASRFSLVLVLVAGFHVMGAITAQRFSAFATTMHCLGTVALGAGIFLSGQIFNLQEHWPGGVMLWAIGAWLGWWLRRDWAQASLVAVLTPAWLAGEWADATAHFPLAETAIGQGLLLLAITYFTGVVPNHRETTRRALAWIGGIELIPAAAFAVVSRVEQHWWSGSLHLPIHLGLVGFGLSFLLPLLLALWLRGKAFSTNLVAAAWVGVVNLIPMGNSILPYVWCGIASLGMIAWGVKELRRERINLGIVGFGITVMTFYFSNVMDKLDRSASLIGLGVLFLGMGWALERTRRKLVARVQGVAL